MSHEYGWTNEYISSRTYREINHALGAITKRQMNDYKFHASIHGIDLKIPTSSEEPVITLTEEHKKLIDQRKAESLVRIRQRSENT